MRTEMLRVTDAMGRERWVERLIWDDFHIEEPCSILDATSEIDELWMESLR
jgi:hypothetical protein